MLFYLTQFSWTYCVSFVHDSQIVRPMPLNKELTWYNAMGQHSDLMRDISVKKPSEKAWNNWVQYRFIQSTKAKHGSAHASIRDSGVWRGNCG